MGEILGPGFCFSFAFSFEVAEVDFILRNGDNGRTQTLTSIAEDVCVSYKGKRYLPEVIHGASHEGF